MAYEIQTIQEFLIDRGAATEVLEALRELTDLINRQQEYCDRLERAAKEVAVCHNATLETGISVEALAQRIDRLDSAIIQLKQALKPETGGNEKPGN